jgi:hypothetical protein
MDRNKISVALIILGILGIIAAILVDIIRTGTLHIQAAQILVIEFSLLAVGLGFLLKQIPPPGGAEANPISRFVKWLEELPMLTWVLAGFLIAYFAFFITPMFFNAPPRIQYFTKYLPDRSPIGIDMLFLTNTIKQWFETGQTPYYNTQIPQYPPITYILFSPVTLIGDSFLLFRLITILTIACFIISSLIIPLLIGKANGITLIVVFFITGLFSYGMQFELERGQFNVITFMFCMSAICLYHFHHSLRRYAYLLFSIAVQLKIYPAIFFVMFIKDWRDWKGNTRRFLALGIFNFLLLFVMGQQAFLEFIEVIMEQVKRPGLPWTGNHSIKAFISGFIENDGYGLTGMETVEFVQRHSGLISNVFLLLFLLCFISIVVRAYRENQQKLDTKLLLACTIGALIIPVSNDYTLSILAGPMALALTSLSNSDYGKRRAIAAVLLITSATAYSAILYPFKYKALFLQNSFSPLFIALICTTFLAHLVRPPEKDPQVTP